MKENRTNKPIFVKMRRMINEWRVVRQFRKLELKRKPIKESGFIEHLLKTTGIGVPYFHELDESERRAKLTEYISDSVDKFNWLNRSSLTQWSKGGVVPVSDPLRSG
jgi:hypothetical protein